MPIQYQIEYRDGFQIWYRPEKMPCMPQHMHRNVEIIYLKEGHSTCTVDLVEYDLNAGDLLFVFSDQLHSYGIPSPHPENYALLFPPDIQGFEEVFSTMLPVCPVLHGAVTEEIEAMFAAAFAACCDKSLPYPEGKKQGYISILLSMLLPLLPMQKKSVLQDNLEYKLIRYCADHYNEPITLRSIAKEFSYSPTYLSHIFNEKFRIGFTDFINSLRIEEAKELLKTAASMTEIAYACGFTSIRNFNRVFKESLGVSPKSYRAKKK